MLGHGLVHQVARENRGLLVEDCSERSLGQRHCLERKTFAYTRTT
jgi:hypothetical protein